MKFKIEAPTVDNNDPFKSDLLNRQSFAANLSRLLQRLSPPFVVAINAPWGSGKTTFIKMWQKQLETSGIPSIYFNAWETDFSLDPLTAFVGEISEYISKHKKSPSASKTIKKVERLTKYVAKKSIPVVVKVVTAGSVDFDDIQEEAIAALTEDIAADVVKKYADEKKDLKAFRAAIEQAVTAITSAGDQNKLIVFVDELDRCRPNYCVLLLERIKHLFNTKNIIFVLSIDNKQLEASVSAMYGAGINSREYLRRFIDIDVQLPEVTGSKFVEGIFERFELNQYFHGTGNEQQRKDLITFFTNLSEILGLSLRAKEQCLTRLCVALSMSTNAASDYPILLVTLILIKAKNAEVYEKYCSSAGAVIEILDYVRDKVGGHDFLLSKFGAAMEGFLILARYNAPFNSPEYSRYQTLANQPHLTRESQRAMHIIELMTSCGANPPSLSSIKNRIELSDRFDA